MKKYKITEEHKIELERIKQKYIDNAFRTDAMSDHDKSQMYVAMKGLYKNAELDYPGDHRVVFVSSPLVAQFVSAITVGLIAGGQDVDESLERAQKNISEMKVDFSNGMNSLDAYIKSFIDITKTFGEPCVYAASNIWRCRSRSALWPWYQVYGEFFKDVAKIPGEWEKWIPLNLDALHGGVRFMTPDFTVIADRPKDMKFDDRKLLHSETGSAVSWRDGMKQYYWHGVNIPSDWIDMKSSLSAEIALTWENIEQRRCACEILGWDRILEELKAEIIDKDDDPQTGELIEVELPDIGTEKFLRVICGTGRTFAIPVPPGMKTALEANAWTYGIKPEDYNLEIRT